MMNRMIWCVIVTLVLISGCRSLETDTNRTQSVSLFNGRNLDGWVIENNALFSVREGLLEVNKGVGWLRSEEVFGDFILEMDVRFVEEGANSGIFVRTGPTSRQDDNGWPDNGYQVQCMDNITRMPALATMIPYGAPPFTRGSDLRALRMAYRPTGQWNHFQITCRGENLTVKLNNTLITTAQEIKNLRGHIGIQAEHGLLEFRHIELQKLD
ncbi:MAG: DUF1080 domain-containing protein [Planctomycetes bacterium]|nr:DUF1080 domain-containing protein [Planctomycetota bacterium]